MLILGLIVFGMLIGWFAQLILGQGTRPNAESLAAGLIGSFVGGLLISLLSGDGLAFRASGIIGSLAGAIIVLAAFGAYKKSQQKQHAIDKQALRSGDPRQRSRGRNH